MIKKFSSNAGWIFLVSALALAIGCDDTGGNPTNPGDGDVSAGGAGGDDGVGGAGGDGGAGGGILEECFVDEDCEDPEDYCLVPAGEAIGACDSGCRAGAADNCSDGEECNLTTRECGCVGNEACGDGEICLDGDCTPGCADDTMCDELTDDGRSMKCDTEGEPPMCVGAFVCCGGADRDMCSVVADGRCEGDQLTGALDCSADPCGPLCTEDADCADAAQYCNVADGRCRDGCRPDDPDACPGATEFCDPDKRECVEIRCDSEDDCPDGFFCDNEGPDATGLCSEGCTEDDDCDDGFVCRDNACFEDLGDCEGDDGCTPEQYCDDIRSFCRDDCEGHGDCEDGEFCGAEDGECHPGCRDDIPAFDTVDNALAIELGDFDADGFRFGTAEGRRYCGSMADFFSVDLAQGERVQVQLRYDAAIVENLNFRLSGDEVMEDLSVIGVENPKVLEYPPINDVRNATTYFAEVFGQIGIDEGLDYTVRVVVACADCACFPDEGEDGEGDDDAATATRQAADIGVYAGNVCSGDQDWFVLAMGETDGLDVQATIDAGSDELEFQIFSAARLAQVGGDNNPNYRSPAMPAMENGQRVYRLLLEANAGNFSGDDWYVRLSARNDEENANYRLRIERLGGEGCPDDGGTEPNDDIATAVNLMDARFNLAQGGALPYDADLELDLATEICARDEDVFCFQADAGDTIEAWTTGGGVVGDLTIQLLDGEGGVVGQRGFHDGDRARWVGATEGVVCIRVDGVEASQGPYDLFVRRNEPLVGECANDVDEFMMGRNDTSATATDMRVVVPGERFVYEAGYMCDVGGSDQDWYAFPVTEQNSALCVMVDGFANSTADLDSSAFSEAPIGRACAARAECQINANDPSDCINGFCAVPCARGCASEEACIAGRCTASPNGYFSRTDFDFEAKNVPKRILGERNGPHFVRVDRGDEGAESSYRVLVTVSPETAADACPRDYQEENAPNDAPEDATPLGSGQVGICDAWLCEQDEGDFFQGDWYEITVPAGEDRTALIEFQPLPVDGRLYLDYYDLAFEDPNDPFGGIRESHNDQAGYQCINIRGGADDRNVNLNVNLALASVDDRDGRVHYTLRVVPTDLDADPQGECLTFGAPNLDPCPEDDPQARGCWPTAIIP